MLYGLLNAFFVLLCFFIVLIILIQKSKGSLGIIGSAGSGAQMLFGGTGGQDLFQKITWTFVALFMGGSLLLAILKNNSVYQSRYAVNAANAPLEHINPEFAGGQEQAATSAPSDEQPVPDQA